MNKIKNILNPGKEKDDEVLYGSGQSSDPVHSGTSGSTTGQGSHFGSSRTGGTDPSTSSSNADTTGQRYGTDAPIGSTDTGNTTSGYGSGNTTKTSRSLMPGHQADDNASIASIKSGVHGSDPGSGLTGSSATGHDLAGDVNKPLPDTPATGATGAGSGLTGRTLADRSVGSSGYDNTTGSTGTDRSFPLGSSSGTTGATGPTSTASSGYGSGTGPYPSSAHQGHLGRDAALGTGVAGAGLAEHERHRHNDPLTSSTTGGSTGYGSTTGGYDSTSGTTSSSTGEAFRRHEHLGHGHTYQGDPCPPGQEHGVLTSGPHATDTANRLDPHIGGSGLGSTGGETAGTGLGSSSGVTGSGLGGSSTTTGPHSSTLENTVDPRVDSNLDGSRTTGTTGAGYGNTGLGSSTLSSTTGTGSEYGTTEGFGRAHGGGIEGTAGGLGGNTTGTTRAEPDLASNRSGDHHYGRDAAIGGTGAAAAGGLYEAEHGRSGTSTTGTTSGTTHDHKDTTSGLARFLHGSRATGTAHDEEGTSGRSEHHLGRDAAVGGAGAAAAGGLYEAEHDRSGPTSTSRTGPTSGASSTGYSNPYSGTDVDPRVESNPRTGTTDISDRHTGRDAGLVGGGTVLGAGAYEAEKHHYGSNEPTQTIRGYESSGQAGPLGASTDTSSLRRDYYGRDAPAAAAESNRGDHHYGRDAALVGGGGAAAGTGVYEAEKHHGRTDQPTTGPGSSGYDSRTAVPRDSSGRDAALAGGAGAIGGGAAGGEFSKVEAEKLRKEQAKEAEKHEKQMAKDEKHHEKALEKQEKAHEKNLEKHEKSHHTEEKEHPDKKKHGLFGFLHREKPDPELKEEEAERQARLQGTYVGSGGPPQPHTAAAYANPDKTLHERDAEAQEGLRGTYLGSGGPAQGTYGKPGPEFAEKDAAAQKNLHGTYLGGGAAAGAGTAALEEHREHEGRNKLHKDPPAGYYDQAAGSTGGTTYKDAPTTGYASQVTGGTGTTALAEGDSTQRGSHLSGVGNKLDPAIADRGDTLEDSNVGGTTGAGDPRYGRDAAIGGVGAAGAGGLYEAERDGSGAGLSSGATGGHEDGTSGLAKHLHGSRATGTAHSDVPPEQTMFNNA
ncbi:MAG: hypothetical protein M1827_006063 [Pycnora praestabilis]|nr:MAG: hypothetical protein M1827_006063 [Pycnora praestabilis]